MTHSSRLTPVHGRGVHANPANRFEELAYEPDPDAYEPDAPPPPTRYYRDATASIIATNESPDVGFDASVNPYRGCEHGCAYCLDGDTLVLRADGRSGPLRDVAVGDVLVGTARDGHYRKYVESTVTDAWTNHVASARRVSLRDGAQLIASDDHRFLTQRGWKHVTGSTSGRDRRPHLTTNDRLMGIGRYLFESRAPSITRKRTVIGRHVKGRADLRVAAIEPLPGPAELYDITTTTGDFIANGVISHNCYARPFHEYLGFSAGLDFETRIMVKLDAPELLRKELGRPSWVPQPLGMCGVTDAYQPIERRLEITRGCLEVLAESRNPVTIVTKNALVARDVDLLAMLARHQAARVYLSVTSLDPRLARELEPRASTPERRLQAIKILSDAGVPVGAMVAPIIPGLNDHEVPRILEAVADHGGRFASYTVLRLPGAVAPLFEAWLDDHAPLKKDRVLDAVRRMRGGQLNDARFGQRMRAEGPFARHIADLFHVSARRHGLDGAPPALSTAAFRRPGSGLQPTLFD